MPIRPAAAGSVEGEANPRPAVKALTTCAEIANNKQLEIDATEIRIRAEHRLGQMLVEQKKTAGFDQGGRPPKTGPAPGSVFTPATLADAGISKNLSSRAQKLAAVPDAECFSEWQ